MTSEANEDVKGQRPFLVWLISGLMVIAVVWLNVYFLMHLLGHGSNPTYAAGLADLTAIDYVRRIIGGLLSLAAAISLFLLRKIAVVLFLTMLGLATILVAYSVLSNVTPPSSFLSLIFLALISWYALRLRKRGLLT